MTVCTLVTGGNAAAREAAIAGLIDPQAPTAVIVEGVDRGAQAGTSRLASAGFTLVRVDTIAVGCPCCDNGMVMRVTLDRALHRRPTYLFVSLAQAAHLPHLQQFLLTPPYAALVSLTDPVSCD